jgi:signal transduction histidine kinase
MDWLAQHSAIISGADAAVELTIAMIILRGVRKRLGPRRLLAWLVASYFLIEALVSLNRTFIHVDAAGTLSRVVLLELIGTVVAVLILVRASHIADVIAVIVDEARYRAFEYERARRDYTQIVRHRIANPLTIIKGATQTLDGRALDEATRHELRTAIIEAAERLEAISLEPIRRGREEYELDPVPRVP